MLNKNQSNKRNSWKYTLVFPALVAFVFLFQIKVIAQEKETLKQKNETKSNSVDLTKIKVEKDLNTLSKGKKVYINGEKSSEKELAKLDTKDIVKIDVIKKNNNPIIMVTTKNTTNQLSKTIKITDKDIYINGIKSTNEEFSKLDKNSIDKMNVNTFENTVRITTKSDKPIIIIDGNLTAPSFKIDDFPTDQIASINVLKEKVAEEKYGSNGKNGVIEIITKTHSYPKSKSENNTDKPMIIINRKKAGSQVGMNNINSNAVRNMNVLKGKSAVEKYGKEGENGVIEITTDTPDKIIMKFALGFSIPPATPPVEEEKQQIKVVGYGTNSKNEIESQQIKVVGYGTNQDKVVNGWKISSIPAERNLKEMIFNDKNVDYKKAIIIIDGKLSNSKKMNKLNPEEIARIGVLKTLEGKQKEAWIHKYGEKALNGIIEIETKGYSEN